MNDIRKKNCYPCVAGTIALKGDAIMPFFEQLEEGWQVKDEHHLERSFKCKNFKEALELVNEFGKIAEEEGHHPDIMLSWGMVKVTLWTHKIDGLSESDFILGAKFDAAYVSKLG